MQLRAEQPADEAEIPDELVLVEEPQAAPPDFIDLGRPSSHLLVATRFHIEWLGVGVGVGVTRPIEARLCLDCTHVIEIAVDITDRERSGAHAAHGQPMPCSVAHGGHSRASPLAVCQVRACGVPQARHGPLGS